MTGKLSIIQYNCGNSNSKSSRPFFDSLTQPHVLAIQEPRYNKYTKSTYCPRPYQLAYEPRSETRVCFMIRRDINASQWKRRQYGSNTAVLELVIGNDKLSIINVYNPRTGGPRIREWQQIKRALREAEGEILLLGDFNVHHSIWGGVGTTCEQHANHLLVETERRDLLLLTGQAPFAYPSQLAHCRS